jgi:SOS-response transcriptional repressor LexA
MTRSERRDATVAFIWAFRAEHEVSPSYREIQAGVGHGSLQTVRADLEALVEQGILRWAPGIEPGSPRTILTWATTRP